MTQQVQKGLQEVIKEKKIDFERKMAKKIEEVRQKAMIERNSIQKDRDLAL